MGLEAASLAQDRLPRYLAATHDRRVPPVVITPGTDSERARLAAADLAHDRSPRYLAATPDRRGPPVVITPGTDSERARLAAADLAHDRSPRYLAATHDRRVPPVVTMPLRHGRKPLRRTRTPDKVGGSSLAATQRPPSGAAGSMLVRDLTG
jgi:hypothetical protein